MEFFNNSLPNIQQVEENLLKVFLVGEVHGMLRPPISSIYLMFSNNSKSTCVSIDKMLKFELNRIPCIFTVIVSYCHPAIFRNIIFTSIFKEELKILCFKNDCATELNIEILQI